MEVDEDRARSRGPHRQAHASDKRASAQRTPHRHLIRKDESGSSCAPMCGRADIRSLTSMKKRLLFLLLVTGLLVLALGGWTVQGLRWAATGGWVRGLPQPA
jgi:hypothetical protein